MAWKVWESDVSVDREERQTKQQHQIVIGEACWSLLPTAAAQIGWCLCAFVCICTSVHTACKSKPSPLWVMLVTNFAWGVKVSKCQMVSEILFPHTFFFFIGTMAPMQSNENCSPGAYAPTVSSFRVHFLFMQPTECPVVYLPTGLWTMDPAQSVDFTSWWSHRFLNDFSWPMGSFTNIKPPWIRNTQ